MDNTNQVICPYGKCDMVIEHDATLKDHSKEINELKVKDAVVATKLDMTNKLLGGILVILTGAIVGILFDILKKGVL